MRVIARLLALCSLSLLSLNALAAPVPGLYQVRETVGSQHAAERLLVLQQALDTLVLRLTGDPEASLRPELLALREAPQRLVSRYVYDGNTLVVDFDPATTGAALREAGLSLWGADRPELLVWWMTETPDGAQLVGDAQDSASPLQKAAQHRQVAERHEEALGRQVQGLGDVADHGRGQHDDRRVVQEAAQGAAHAQHRPDAERTQTGRELRRLT